MKKFLIFIILFSFIKLHAQDTLPNFSASIISSDKVRISWTNPFLNCTQISVQKSYDSLRFFKTIFSPLSPELPQNGYIDYNFLTGIKIYYRILYIIDDANFFFSESKQATNINYISNEKQTSEFFKNKPKPELLETIKKLDSLRTFNFITKSTAGLIPLKKVITIYKRSFDSLYRIIDGQQFEKFRDSISTRTKDTLMYLENDFVILKPYVAKPLWKPSVQIFTTNKGYTLISLPKYKLNKYSITFFDEFENELFKIKHIKSDKVFLEKSNFLHEGWFYFELYDDGELIEKNKFFIAKDF